MKWVSIFFFQVELRYNLFHAIEKNFLEGVEAIFHYVPCKDLKTTSHTYYFYFGLTPLLLAAHNNNYEVLKLLCSYGHQMEVNLEQKYYILGIGVRQILQGLKTLSFRAIILNAIGNIDPPHRLASYSLFSAIGLFFDVDLPFFIFWKAAILPRWPNRIVRENEGLFVQYFYFDHLNIAERFRNSSWFS